MGIKKDDVGNVQTHTLSVDTIPGEGVVITIKDKAGVEATAVVRLSPTDAREMGELVYKAACVADGS